MRLILLTSKDDQNNPYNITIEQREKENPMFRKSKSVIEILDEFQTIMTRAKNKDFNKEIERFNDACNRYDELSTVLKKVKLVASVEIKLAVKHKYIHDEENPIDLESINKLRYEKTQGVATSKEGIKKIIENFFDYESLNGYARYNIYITFMSLDTGPLADDFRKEYCFYFSTDIPKEGFNLKELFEEIDIVFSDSESDLIIDTGFSWQKEMRPWE